MLALMLSALILSLVIIVFTVRAVRSDGYGWNPKVRSYSDWDSDALPSRPYRDL